MFSKQAANDLLGFATVQNVMRNINMVDRSKSHFPVQYVSHIDFISQK